MAIEIERKFLVDESRLGPLVDGQSIRQGYIGTTDLCAVRARIAGTAAWLTLKGESRGSVDCSSAEREFGARDGPSGAENTCLSAAPGRCRLLSASRRADFISSHD